MQVRRGTGRVNALDVCDQQASAGHRDTLPEAGRDMLVMYPADAQKRAQLGSAALLAHEGPKWPDCSCALLIGCAVHCRSPGAAP